MYAVVKAQLLGSRLELGPATSAGRPGEEAGGGLRRVASEVEEPSSLLRFLEDRWQFGG